MNSMDVLLVVVGIFAAVLVFGHVYMSDNNPSITTVMKALGAAVIAFLLVIFGIVIIILGVFVFILMLVIGWE